MTGDIVIWRAAKLLVGQHGADAPIHAAAQRANRLFENGDVEGRAIWLRVLKAVKELRAGGRISRGTVAPVWSK